MEEQTNLTRIKKLLFTSTWLIPLFLIIPAFTILNLRLRLPVSGNLLLINNGCFALFIAMRFVWYLLKMRGEIRYGADRSVPKSVLTLDRPASQLQADLSVAGYRFDADGCYGEKRDLGYLGTTVLYGGLMVLLMFGSYDYMREYSVMGRLGVGEPMSLDGKGLLGEFEAGSLAGTSKLPQLQIRKQILPNSQWPNGATEIALLSKDRKELAKGTISPGKPFRYGGLDFHMTRFIFDALIVIKKDKSIVYESFVKFIPLPQKKGVYSYYGSLKNDKSENVGGVAWLNPENKAVRVEATLDGKKIIDTELELWGKNKITQGEYIAVLEGLAHWTEIRVARGRHRVMLMIGALLFMLGGITRLAVRPQRVWLEEAEEGCRVRAKGGKTLGRFQGKQ